MAQTTLSPEQIDALITTHLEPHGDPRKGEYGVYWLKESGVPVRAIIGYYQGGAEGDVDVVAKDYDVPREAVEAALAFYERDPSLIDAWLTLNRA